MTARCVGLAVASVLFLCAAACDKIGTARGSGDDASGAAAPAAPGTALEARYHPAGSAIVGEASWKARVKDGRTQKKFKVQVGGAKPASVLAVRVDGVEVGTMTVDLDGEGELEFEDRFPAGFVEPKAGSRVEVGDLFEVTLATIERLAALVATITGPLAGEVEYKRERIGGQIVREFSVEITRGPVGAELAVTIGGQTVGSIVIDDEGQGDLNYADGGQEPFPADFPEPQSGSLVGVGPSVKVKLQPKG